MKIQKIFNMKITINWSKVGISNSFILSRDEVTLIKINIKFEYINFEEPTKIGHRFTRKETRNL